MFVQSPHPSSAAAGLQIPDFAAKLLVTQRTHGERPVWKVANVEPGRRCKGLEMATHGVANATRSFQAVAKLPTSSKLTTKLKTQDVSDSD